LHSTIASQEKTFDLESVAKNLSEKLIRRHPHVFKDPSLATNAEEVVKNWEEIKKEEKQSNGGASSSRIDKSYLNFPALFSANKIGVKTAKLNFDWDNAQQVAYKVEEEWQELKEELVASKISKERVTEEMGDFLFSGAQLARHLGIDPEDCLRQANKKFLRRFNHMERLIEEDGKILEEMNQSEMDVFWDSAKSQEKAAKNN
ncbi:MAG: MazG family protein, partial [Halobacteriovoraceae bacterium]|nr:MazG family protein [Halobacteriovoraceae bacterium]